MATCKECVHNNICNIKQRYNHPKYALQHIEKYCEHFKDLYRFVELPDVGDYDTTTTLDEAIDHCYQVATSTDESICTECKAEHMRLCGWLGDLKSRIVAEQALKEREGNGN